LSLPEEKTWVCPLEDGGNDFVSSPLVIGRATKWILYNEASVPIVVERVMESTALDGVEGKQVKSAVYPHGKN
jgi:hypothetical protein